ncbi:MAG TPA: nucleoside recognition domain-containing protein, partial [Candidatus Dormibacteraeota bacterium]|nr:nucleoside recognition domain-containing protein [Candidatus Dormibacteraeota bacterium]
AFVARGIVSARGVASLRLATELEPERWRVAMRWVSEAVDRRGVARPVGDRLARLVTAPWPGLPVFVAVTLGAFAFVTLAGGWLAGLLSGAWSAAVSPALATAVPALVPVPILARALLWALDGGLLGMLAVGIPYVLTFYVLLAALEDSGYLTSAAVLSDRLFGALGLPGRAAIPLLAAAGCNVPAIYGTRILRSRRERILASFLVTLTPCSARTAVVIAALAPFGGPGVALAAFAVIAGVAIAAGIGANALVPGRQPALVLELAPLRRPIARHVLTKAWARFRAFAMNAAPIMLAGSFVLGLVYESGLWRSAAALLSPVFAGWLGLPTVVGIAIVFSILRKELAVQLLIALAAVSVAGGVAHLDTLMTPAQLFVYAVVASVSVPCVATIAALRSELGARAAVAISGGSIALALGAGGVLARLLGTV